MYVYHRAHLKIPLFKARNALYNDDVAISDAIKLVISLISLIN